MLDGARNALLGYLYQLLGTASVRIREVPPGSDAWADLIARVGDGEVRCEEFGQDATVRPLGLPDRGVVAIQFKHSATTGNAFERGELIDILFAFDRSRREAEAEGVSIDQYVLITNRGIDANAQQLIAEGHTSPDPPDALRLRPTTKAGDLIADNTRRLAPYGGDPDAAARALHAVGKALCMPPPQTFEGDLNRLRGFAARYGVLDREWDARLNALIGAFVLETAAGRAVDVTRNWLKGHLVGDPNAANLQFGSDYLPHISTACIGRLDEGVKLQHRISDRYYLPRDAQQNIRDQLALHPIVFVFGDGGCGKSLAVAQYLRSVCDRQLVWTESAAAATETSIVEAINRARLPGCPGGGTDRFLSDVRARLNVANPATPPLWTIDLDGVDEAPKRRAELRDIINLCWAGGNRERSPALLVVTCRSSAAGARAPEQLVSEWINTPEPDLVRGVGFVPVGEFLPEDLVEAARLRGERPEERIVHTLDPVVAGRADRFADVEPVSDGTIQFLRHPVVWGAYAALDEDHRNGILDGDPARLSHLANQLLIRFLIRCRARRDWSDDLMLDNALRVAARLITGSPPYAIDEWERGCAGFLSTTEARMLYNESLSYGLVRRESGSRWRWGHQFVVDYLANQPDPRGA